MADLALGFASEIERARLHVRARLGQSSSVAVAAVAHVRCEQAIQACPLIDELGTVVVVNVLAPPVVVLFVGRHVVVSCR